MNLQTRMCGAVHPKEGAICVVPVYYEPNGHCDGDRVYQHEGPHRSARDKDGTVHYMWEAVMVIKDVPFNAYSVDPDEPEFQS